MTENYVLDACALIAYLFEEEGAQSVSDMLAKASAYECDVYMHAINLLEVYYGIRREYGDVAAKEMLAKVKNLQIHINYDMPENIFLEAGRLKSEYKLSLADSIGLAQAVLLNASFVSSDHHELDIVDVSENINIHWFR